MLGYFGSEGTGDAGPTGSGPLWDRKKNSGVFIHNMHNCEAWETAETFKYTTNLLIERYLSECSKCD